MREWTLELIINHFDQIIKGIDFKHLPAHDSEDYRLLVMQTANDVMFSDGRYNANTEWTLEMFDAPEVCLLVRDLAQINALSKDRRQRLQFYLDLKEVCYPLFRGQAVDWSAWPWQLTDPASSLDNEELFDLITQATWPNLSAAILYDLKERACKDVTFSSVAHNELSETFFYDLENKWKKIIVGEDPQKDLVAAISRYANRHWMVENHIKVGQLLGFDTLAQGIYDAFDTYIDDTYRHNQVLFAKALAQWIRENMDLDKESATQEELDVLKEQVRGLIAQYKVTSPDIDYSWNILYMDVLGLHIGQDDPVTDDEDDDIW